MPSYTLIALLLSLFGAAMSLMSALRSHHGDTMKSIRADHQNICAAVKSAHEVNGLTWNHAIKLQRQICRWLLIWDKAMVAPIWVFSVVVLLVSVVALSVQWPSGNPVPLTSAPGLPPVITTASIASIDQFIIGNSFLCKSMVGLLLFTNIFCYAAAWCGQKAGPLQFRGCPAPLLFAAGAQSVGHHSCSDIASRKSLLPACRTVRRSLIAHPTLPEIATFPAAGRPKDRRK